MLTGILIFFHVMACLTLIFVILLQVGKGHGLSGGSMIQGGVQSVFGTKTADFLSKATSVMAIIFVITCISLDVVHTQKSRSLFYPKAGSGAPAIDMEKLKAALEKLKQEEAAKQNGGTSAVPSVSEVQTAAAAAVQETAQTGNDAVSQAVSNATEAAAPLTSSVPAEIPVPETAPITASAPETAAPEAPAAATPSTQQGSESTTTQN